MIKNKKSVIFYVLICISLFLFVVGLILFGTNSSKKVSQEKVIFNYNENSNVDYKVFLNDSDNDEYLGKDKLYPKDNIKNIVAKFNYVFLGDKKLNFNYKENVVAVLISKNLNGNTVFSQEYELTTQNSVQEQETTGFKIGKVIDIDYNYYLQILKDQDIDLAKTKNELSVSLNVETNTFIEDDITSKSSTKIIVPLNEDNFSISESVVKNNKKITAKVSETLKDEEAISLSYTFFGISISILFITLIYYFINPDILSNYKSEYRKVRKAVRDYDELIARTYKMPPIKDKKVFELDRIDKFLSVFEKEDLPITMVEKDTYVTFVMVKKDKAWTYSIEKLDK